MRQLILFFCLSLTVSLSAQVGLTGFYNFNDARTVGDLVDPEDYEITYENGPEIALNYWFRLPTKRIEFQPTVYYAPHTGDSGWNQAGFQFKTNIYVFDLGTDCDCPTFGKQGPQLEKGFFLQLSPGVSRHWLTTPADLNAGQTALTLGAGLGVDIGLSNLLTITPIASVRHTLTDFSDTIYTDENNVDLEIGDRLTSIQLGLQATFRFDKKRY